MTFTPPHLLDGARWANLRIGILGGSFNPAHEGHYHISLIALNALKLDFVWWLVTPHNPLKDQNILLPYDDRVAAARKIVTHPHVLVTDLERQMNVNISYDTVRALKLHFPRTSFVWLTGMDNALTFHRWHNWRDILKEMATAHIARPPAGSLIAACPLRLLRTQAHDSGGRSKKADLSPGHTYWLLQKRMLGISSTAIRNSF